MAGIRKAETPGFLDDPGQRLLMLTASASLHQEPLPSGHSSRLASIVGSGAVDLADGGMPAKGVIFELPRLSWRPCCAVPKVTRTSVRP